MAAGVKPTRIFLEGWALPDEVSIDGDRSGDDVDWDNAPGVGGQDQWKQPVRCATTGAVTIATALNAGDAVDGVTLAAGDRVLVKDQAAPAENGIWIAGTTPERAADMDEDEEVLGAAVYVIAGTVHAGTAWAVSTATAVVVGTDAIAWAELGSGTGSGLDTALVTVAASGATETVDLAAARTYDVTLTANCAVSLTGAVTAEAWAVSILLRQDGTGGRTVTWTDTIGWAGGSAPVLQTAGGSVDIVTLLTVDGGTTWLGAHVAGGSTVGALDDLSDVTISTPATGDRLRYDGSGWVNSRLRWEPHTDYDGLVMLDSAGNPMMHEVLA